MTEQFDVDDWIDGRLKGRNHLDFRRPGDPCPNPDCTELWHGLPRTPHHRADPGCPGSHLFTKEDDGP